MDEGKHNTTSRGSYKTCAVYGQIHDNMGVAISH